MPNEAKNESNTSSRRSFLKHSTSAAVGASLVSSLIGSKAVHAATAPKTNDILNIGLIGCGGRGTGAAVNAFSGDKNIRLVAMADAFEDNLKQSRRSLSKHSQYGVEDDKAFFGFDAYKQLIDTDVDVVILATPPHFRPVQYRYAIENDKHCFVEKPIGVDALGVKHVMETNEMAKKKGLSVVSGLCWRYDSGIRETIRQIKEEKFIGEIRAIESEYLSKILWHRGDKPEWSRMEYQMRNWLYFNWLSGDQPTEQHIHGYDKVLWLMDNELPIKVSGMGGRIQRTHEKYGDVFDHFAFVFEFKNGVRATCRCRQQNGVMVNTDEHVVGTEGTGKVIAHKLKRDDGKTWEYDGPKPSMYEVEHKELFANLRAGTPIHNGDYMAKSTLMSIMGRLAVYTGQELTLEQVLNSKQRLGPETYEWTDIPEPEYPIPGETKFV